MMYKLYIEDGEYQDITTKEPRNLQKCNIAWTPDGVNVGWDEFATDEEAMVYFNVELKPVPEEPQE